MMKDYVVGQGFGMSKGRRTEVLQGTLDLRVLKTLDTMGTMHGWGIARRIEQVSGDVLQLNQGTIYPALIPLGQKRYFFQVSFSENNRRAKFYSITPAGRKRLIIERENWDLCSTEQAAHS